VEDKVEARRAAGLPRRVAVTGGAGFIGVHTVEALVDRGCAVLVVDDLSHACGRLLPPAVELAALDVGSAEAARALRDFRPEAVLHLASRGGVERARRDPAEHVRRSVASSVGLFHAAAAAGARRLVTASSGGAVYGAAAALPTTERRRPHPVSAYGAGKLAEEAYLAMFERVHQVETLALRYGNVYGPWQDGTGEAGVVAITCQGLADGRRPVVYGDGEQTRDFVYVGDVVAANLTALAAVSTGVVNIGTGRETSVREVVWRLTRLHGGGVQVEYAERRHSEVRRSALDARLAGSRLGWAAATTLTDGLRLTLDHFRARRAPALPTREGR
jgi:UDP-glucose 4-epimerase